MAFNQVKFLSAPARFQKKEDLYLTVRRRETRVLEDEQVKAFPIISKSSPYAKEWRWRRRSFTRLKHYLLQKKSPKLRILDLGCGNGWMSNRLAENPNWDVTAVDLNQEELEQGARLFGRKNLQFVYADILAPESTFQDTFHIIVLAASVQYFPNLKALFAALRPLLAADGEIHILDSHFYPDKAAAKAAQQRTVDYYTKVGVPDMADYYHHHLIRAIRELGGEDSNKNPWIWLLQKLGWYASFAWIRVVKGL